MNPSNDGRVVRINIPPLSAEVRRKMVTRIKELGEEGKVSIRNIRRDANKAADGAEKSKSISEDDRDQIKDLREEIQTLASETGLDIQEYRRIVAMVQKVFQQHR